MLRGRLRNRWGSPGAARNLEQQCVPYFIRLAATKKWSPFSASKVSDDIFVCCAIFHLFIYIFILRDASHPAWGTWVQRGSSPRTGWSCPQRHAEAKQILRRFPVSVEKTLMGWLFAWECKALLPSSMTVVKRYHIFFVRIVQVQPSSKPPF